jgi:hypothetical protein
VSLVCSPATVLGNRVGGQCGGTFSLFPSIINSIKCWIGDGVLGMGDAGTVGGGVTVGGGGGIIGNISS